MKLAIVLSTHDARFEAVAFKGDFETNLAKVARWGYDAVELAVRDPRLVDAPQLKESVSRHGLAVAAIGTGQAWGDEGLSFTSSDAFVRRAAVDRIASHIPLAARLEALLIIGLIRGVSPQGQSHEQSMTFLVEALRECSNKAADAGVRLALEPINRYETDLIPTVAEGLSLIETVGADNLGLLLDTFHMNIEEPVIEDSIRACRNRFFHVHVADSNRWYPGAGHLDFASILEAVSSTGYRGYISGEFLPRPNADTAAQAAIKYLKRIGTT